MSRRSLTALAAAIALASAACGGATGGNEVAAPPTSAGPSPAASVPEPSVPGPATRTAPEDAPAAAVAALDFVAPALAGGEVRGAEYAGSHVVLWMWAPW